MYKKNERSLKEERTTLPHRRRTQSFSSSLLDSIYRSIDEEPALSKKQINTIPPCRGRIQFLGEEEDEDINNNKGLTILKSQRYTSSSDSSTGNVVKNQPKMEKGRRHQGLDFTSTKLRALKIYGELKKVKQQPISPGGRIASFLNSIFSPRRTATKKAKICSIDNVIDKSTKPKSSSCSASSFSRPCGQKSLLGKESEKKHLRSINDLGFPGYLSYDGEEEEGDDDMSCSSSELFELDHHHLVGIGNGRYREELPVYETTSFETNQAIANGFFV